MKQTETLKALWSRWKYAALIAAAGAALLLLPAGGGRTDAAPAAETEERVQDTVREMETRMEAILKTIDGTGELHLMLAADTGTARQLAQDTELSYSGAVSAPDDYLRREETVLTGSGSGEGPVVTQTRCPTWRGALVVCQGGGDAQVRFAVTAAVSALTGLGADRITVAKCQ